MLREIQNSSLCPTDTEFDAKTTIPLIPKNAKQLLGRLLSLNPKYPNFDIFDKLTILGRRNDCHIAFRKERHVSGIHCKITCESGKSSEKFFFFIEDISSNGTWVNENRIVHGRLYNGDQISLGTPAAKVTTECTKTVSYIFQNVTENMSHKLSDEFEQHYIVHNEIGRGHFSIVKLATNRKTGEQCAVKIIRKKRFWHITKTKEQILREIEILKQLQHPHITSYKDVVDTHEVLYIVLELVTGGELFERISNHGALPEPQAREIFEQILQAVDYLHSKGIAHRDLKPENILLDADGNVKITDFGLARFTGQKATMTSLCGTPEYLAPEVIEFGLAQQNQTTPENPKGYGKAVDMWSLGVILYIILAGEPPFDNQEKGSLLRQIEGGYFCFDGSHTQIPELAKDLITKLLTVDPKQRFTAQQALSHSWIAQKNPILRSFKKTSTMSMERLPSPRPFRLERQLIMNSSPENVAVNFIDWSLTTDMLAIALQNVVYLWNGNTDNFEELPKIDIGQTISSVSWCSSSNHYLAISTTDNTVKLWDVQKSQIVHQFSDFEQYVCTLAWNKYTLSTGASNGKIINFDVRTKNAFSTFNAHPREINRLTWSPDGQQMASVSSNMVKIWELNASGATCIIRHNTLVRDLAWCPWKVDQLATAGGDDYTLRIWNTQTGQSLIKLETAAPVNALQWCKHYKEILTGQGSNQNPLILWKFPSMRQKHTFTDAKEPILCMVQSPKSQTVVTSGRNNVLNFWEVFQPSPLQCQGAVSPTRSSEF